MDITQSPYMISLKIRQKNGKKVSCGGSLVTDTTILTAAHCVDTWTKITTYCGSLRKWTGQSRQVIKVVMPKAYTGANNDLALLTVSEPFDLNLTCGPLSLPNKGSPMCKDGTGTLSGWGMVQEKPFVRTQYLKRAERTIIPLAKCEILELVKPKYRQDQDSLLCVKNDPTTSGCVGDSGSGLVKTIGGIPTVVGVASWGVGCSREGIYANVCSFMNFPQAMVEISPFGDPPRPADSITAPPTQPPTPAPTQPLRPAPTPAPTQPPRPAPRPAPTHSFIAWLKDWYEGLNSLPFRNETVEEPVEETKEDDIFPDWMCFT